MQPVAITTALVCVQMQQILYYAHIRSGHKAGYNNQSILNWRLCVNDHDKEPKFLHLCMHVHLATWAAGHGRVYTAGVNVMYVSKRTSRVILHIHANIQALYNVMCLPVQI